MSLSGKLLRGLGWFNNRNAMKLEDHGPFKENLFLPNDILKHPHKMEELEFYLDFVGKRDPNKVHKILEQVRLLDLTNKIPQMTKKAKELEGDLRSDEEIEKEAAEKEAAAANDKTIDYSSMTKTQLVDVLNKVNVEFSDTATKAELLELTGGI